MAKATSSDGLRVYLVALGGEGDLAPVVFHLNSPFDKMASEEHPPFLVDPLMKYLHQESGKTKLVMKFINQNGLDENCQLDLDADEAEKEENLHLTIDPAKSTATLTAYEFSEGGPKIWKSTNLYSVVLVPTSDCNASSAISVFGEAQKKYKGNYSSKFYPLHINLTRDFEETKEILGEGTYGLVRRCVRNGVACAVKRMLGKPSGAPPSEVEAMLRLSDADNVVKMYSAWGHKQEKDYIVYISMEIFERSLEDYLAAREAVDLSKSTSIFIEIMTGVRSMHHCGVIHRDLKPMNILMDKEDHVAIADFGTCVIKPYPGAPITYWGDKFIGTEYYSDPVIGSNFKHAEEVDIYSCGIIYSEMHLVNVSKRKKLIKDIDQKIRYKMRNRGYDFLKSSIWKGWAGDIEIVKQTLLIKANPSVILNKLGVSSSDQEE